MMRNWSKYERDEWRAYEQCNNEFRKQERYCKEQREVLRGLEDLAVKERTMYELDHRKDQVMTVQVELRPESVRQLNHDLAEVCARVNQLQPALPDGRRLVLRVDGMTLSPASRGSSTASMRSPEMRELTVLDPPHFPSPRLM